MDRIPKYQVVHKLQKRSLLIAINCVAGLSIFFFGYDQGVMGGVNTARSYVNIMKFGHYDPIAREVVIDNPTLQGGIVSSYELQLDDMILISKRLLSTIFLVPSLVLSLEVGLVINLAVSIPSSWLLFGPLSVLLSNALHRTIIG